MSNSERAALTERLRDLGELQSTESAYFHQAAAAAYGLGLSDLKALQLLLREGPCTPGDLARRMRLTTGAVTTLLDRLERRQLIVRSPHPDDRRSVTVRVNTETLAAGESVYAGIADAFARLHDGLTASELAFLVDYYEKSIAITRAEAGKLSERQR